MRPYSLNRKAEAYTQACDLELAGIGKTNGAKKVRRNQKRSIRGFWKKELRKAVKLKEDEK